MTEQPLIVDDCWNRIGVWANREVRSCEKLTTHIHCRNCSVYKDAGQALLQRPVELLDPDEVVVDEFKPVTDRSYLCFRVGQEWFAINTALVLRSINPISVRKIPHLTTTLIEGICYSDGDSLLAVDMLSLMPTVSAVENGNKKKKSFERFILMNSPIGTLALRVSEVWGTQRCVEADLKLILAGNTEKAESLIKYRLPWQGDEVSVIETDTLYQMLQQQL